MTRTSAPPSRDETSATSLRPEVLVARRGPLLAAGRLTHSWNPWNRPPLTTSASGGFSMWRIPAPAVIHWVSPLVMTPPPPFESLCSNVAVDHVGDGLEAAMRVPGRALRFARRVLDLAHLVEMDERVEIGQVDPGERAPDREALPFEAARRARDAPDRALAGDVGSGSGMRGRTVMSSTTTAGMAFDSCAGCGGDGVAARPIVARATIGRQGQGRDAESRGQIFLLR